MTLADDFLRGDVDDARRALARAYAMGVVEGERRSAERARLTPIGPPPPGPAVLRIVR
jgi:hypothetical protein